MQGGGMWGWNVSLEIRQKILDKVISGINNTHYYKTEQIPSNGWFAKCQNLITLF